MNFLEAMKPVTIDYDGTLSRTEVQEFVKELIQSKVKVFILTSRFDELHKHLYPGFQLLHQDIHQTAMSVGIPVHRIIMTNMESKGKYLKETNVLFHLDDDESHLQELIDEGCKTVGINVRSNGWKELCYHLLKRF